MDIAFIKDAKDYVDGDQGGQDQEWFIGQGRLEGQGRSLEAPPYAVGKSKPTDALLNRLYSLSEGDAGGEVERDRHCRELPLPVYDKRPCGLRDPRNCAERDLPACPL